MSILSYKFDFTIIHVFSDYVNMFCSQELIEQFELSNSIKIVLPSKDLKSYIPIYITYDESVDFEYFTMERCVCDGTLAFMTDLMKDCFNKIVGLQTCNITKIPSDFQENPFKYEITYTVGEDTVPAGFRKITEAPVADGGKIQNQQQDDRQDLIHSRMHRKSAIRRRAPWRLLLCRRLQRRRAVCRYNEQDFRWWDCNL